MFTSWHESWDIPIRTAPSQRWTVFYHIIRWKNIALLIKAVWKIKTKKYVGIDCETGSHEIFARRLKESERSNERKVEMF